MKIEEGKYYKNHRGEVKGPLKLSSVAPKTYPFYDHLGNNWTSEGKYRSWQDGSEDLIEEWVEPPSDKIKLSGETIDMIALDSLKWHMQDGDMEPLQMEAFRIVLRYYGDNT